MAVTVRDINSLVYRYFVPRAENNVFNERPILALFKKGAKVKRYPRQVVRQPLITGTGVSGRYGDFDIIKRERKEVTSYAHYDFGGNWSSITISHKDKLKTGTKNDIIDILKTKQENAEETLSKDIATDLITGVSTTANSMVGLETAINGTAAQSFGGKTSSDIAKWDNQIKDLSTAAPTWSDIVNFKTKCTQGTKTPDHFLGDKYVNAYIWANLLSPKERYTDGELGAAGKLPVVCALPWVSDELLESSGDTGGKLYLINTKHIWLAIEKDDNMKFWPFQKPTNQFAFSAFYTISTSLVMNRRDVHGVMKGISI